MNETKEEKNTESNFPYAAAFNALKNIIEGHEYISPDVTLMLLADSFTTEELDILIKACRSLQSAAYSIRSAKRTLRKE